MSHDRTFTASEAASITGVRHETQLDWRRREFLPSAGGRWTRYTVSDLCRLRLLSALTAVGIPVGFASTLLDEFAPALEKTLAAGGEGPWAESFAVFAREPDGKPNAFVANDWREIRPVLACEAAFQSAIILNLATLACGMAAAMREITGD